MIFNNSAEADKTDFVDVMGTVISGKIGSTASRIGYYRSWKYKKILDNDDILDD